MVGPCTYEAVDATIIKRASLIVGISRKRERLNTSTEPVGMTLRHLIN